MHASVRAWVSAVVNERYTNKWSTLEVGSRDVNGGVRDLFTGRYLGIDRVAGKGVDLVVQGRYDWIDLGYFDQVVCLEVLEHDLSPWLTVQAMADRLFSGGLLIVTARGYDSQGCFPVHDYPGDYWRFTPMAIRAMFEHAGIDTLKAVQDPEAPGVFALGTKR